MTIIIEMYKVGSRFNSSLINIVKILLYMTVTNQIYKVSHLLQQLIKQIARFLTVITREYKILITYT